MSRELTVLFLMCIYLFLSCNKEVEPEVEVVEVYKNKFFFLWDGVPVYDTTDNDYRMDVSAHKYNSSFIGIGPKLKKKTELYGFDPIFDFYLAIEPLKIGIQSFYTHKNQAHISRYNDLPCGKYYVITNWHHEMLVEKIDKVNQVVRGKFSFSAANKCKDTIHVTKGYFDVKYKVIE